MQRVDINRLAGPLRFPKSSRTTVKILIFVLVITFSVFSVPLLLPSTIISYTNHQAFSSSRTMLPRAPRTGRSLIYWTPHKTGSTSMRLWLKIMAEVVGTTIRAGSYYPYMTHTNWHIRQANLSKESCNFIAGHIRITPALNRPHEGTLGSVISTTRKSMDTLASKHFQRTSNSLERDLEQLLNKSSEKSRRWFFYFQDLDPCEQLRYYDGEEGCEKDEDLLLHRARSIAERIDCVVDTDDPDEDVNALCEVMRVENCPAFPRKNVHGRSMYKQLFDQEHITPIMQRVLRVTELLRDELMKRRCRFLTDGSGLSTPGLEEPKWPFVGCKNVS